MTMAAMKQPFQQPAPAGVPAPKFVQKQNEEDDVDDDVTTKSTATGSFAATITIIIDMLPIHQWW